MIERMVFARSGRAVALARLILAALLLASVLLGQLTQSKDQAAARFLLGTYLVYSVTTLLLHRVTKGPQRLALAASAGDVAMATMLILATGRSDSPFFSPMIFIILSAALQWGSRGARWSGVGLLVIYLAIGLRPEILTGQDRDSLQLFIVRLGYLGVATMVAATLAGHIERLTGELGRLAAAPWTSRQEDERPLAACLDHALAILGSGEGALLWVDPDRGTVEGIVRAGGDRTPLFERGVGAAGPIDPHLLGRAFLWDRANRRASYAVDGQLFRLNGAVLSMTVAGLPEFDRALAFGGQLGREIFVLLIFSPPEWNPDRLAIMSAIGMQVALWIEGWAVENERRDTIEREARLRLGRDLHDGVLQFLAGTRLQLDLISGTDLPDPARARLDAIRAGIIKEQSELRGRILRDRAAASPARDFAIVLEQIAAHLSDSWGVDIRIDITGLIQFSAAAEDEIVSIVRESVANAVRHGSAKRIDIAIAAAGRAVDLTIRDDGSGFAPIDSADPAAGAPDPRSIRERVHGLRGSLVVESSAQGATLSLHIPLREAA